MPRPNPRSVARPDPIVGARQAAETGPGEVAPIVMWSYLAALVKEYDALAGSATATKDGFHEALTLLADAIPDPKGAIDSPRWHQRMDALAASLAADA